MDNLFPMEETLGIRVRIEMVRRGWDQTRMAQELGMTQTTLSRRLNGSREWTAADIAALTRVLDIPAAELLALLPKRLSA